jgi:hypothetical protein
MHLVAGLQERAVRHAQLPGQVPSLREVWDMLLGLFTKQLPPRSSWRGNSVFVLENLELAASACC